MKSEVLYNQLLAYINKQRKMAKINMIVSTVIFGGMIIGGLFIKAHGNDIYFKIGILAFFALILAVLLFFTYKEFKLFDPQNSKLLEMLETNNSDGHFVWIYVLKHVRNGIASWHLVFKTEDKQHYQLSLPDESHTSFMNMLQQVVTNTTYGYSDELQRAYNKNPKDLLQA